jgi:hypothetical protein
MSKVLWDRAVIVVLLNQMGELVWPNTSVAAPLTVAQSAKFGGLVDAGCLYLTGYRGLRAA